MADHVQRSGDRTVIKGRLAGHPVDITRIDDPHDPRFELAPGNASGLLLANIIPELAELPGFAGLAFDKLTVAEKTLVATSELTLRDSPLSLACDIRNRTVSLSSQGGAGLGLVIPALQDAPLLDRFLLESLTGKLSAKTVSATGTFEHAAATCSLDASRGLKNLVLDLKAAGEPIRLGDVLPDLADAPVSRDFAFTDLTYDTAARALSAAGLVNRAKLTASIDTRRGIKNLVLDLKAADHPLALEEVIGALGGIPLVDQFTFESLRCVPSARIVSATGKLVNAEATATLDADQGMKNLVLDLHATKAISLGDLLPPLRDTPVLNDFTFVELRYAAADKTLSATGKVNDAEMTAAIDVAAGVKNPTLSLTATRGKVTLGDFIPAVAGVPGVGLFALEQLAYRDRTLSAEASFGSSRADLFLRFPKPKTLRLDLKPRDASPDLARLLPDLANLPGIGDFHLVDMAFDEATKSLSALVRMGTASATLLWDREKSGKTGKKSGNVFKLTSPDLHLGDLVASLKGVPGLASLAFDELAIGLGSIEARIDIAGRSATLVENLGKGFAALELGALDAAALVPKAGGTVLDGLKLSGSLFLFVKNAVTLSRDDFPADSRDGLSGIDFSAPFKAGVNLLAQINPGDLGKLKAPLSRLGLGKGKLPLRGMLPGGIFGYLAKALDHDADQSKPAPADTGGLLQGIVLGIALDPPRIPGVQKFASFDHASLVVTGDLGDASLWGKLPAPLAQYKPKGEVDISLQGGITLTVGSFRQDMAALVDLNAADKAGALSILAVARDAWSDPFGIKGLTVRNGGYVLTLAGDSSGAKADLGFFGTAKLHATDNLAVSAEFEERGGLPALKYFEIAGPLSLADLAPDIPHGSACVLRDIKLRPNGIEAVAQLKLAGFDSRYAFYLFDMKTAAGTALVAALDLNGQARGAGGTAFSLGALARAAGLKHKSAATIQAHLDGMAVANAALVLSSRQINPVTVDQLCDGIAKDLFTRIFGNTKVPVKVDNVTFLSDVRADLLGEVGRKLVHGAGGVNLGLDGSAVINGAVGGLFDAAPLSLDLEILLAGGFSLDHLTRSGLKLPKFLKARPSAAGTGVKDGLFLKVLDDTFEIGLLSGFDVTLNKTTLDFTGTLGVQIAEEDIGLSLSGSMSDTWKNALGIKGFELKNVAVTGEIEDGPPPSLKFGLGGEANILDHDFAVAADASLGLAGEVPIPDGLGVKSSTSQLDVEAYKIMGYLALGETAFSLALTPEMWPLLVGGVALEAGLSAGGLAIYDEVKGRKVTFDDLKNAPGKDAEKFMDGYAKLEAWLLGGKDVYVSFATPGASDVNLGIPDGIHFSGDVQLFGGALKSPRIHPDITWIYKIAQAVGSVRHTAKKAGREAKTDARDDLAAAAKDFATLRDIVAKELGLIKKDVSVKYPRPSAQDIKAFLDSLHFKVNDAFRIGSVEFAGGADVTLLPFKVATRANLFGSEEDVELSIRNGSLALTTRTRLAGICETDLILEFDPAKNDFTVIADLKGNPALQKWMVGEIQQGIKEIGDSAGEKFKALNQDLAAAQKARDEAAHALDAAQKAAASVTRDAVARLQSTTDKYHQDYEYAQSQYNKCSGWKVLYCKAKWKPRKDLAWDTWQASQELLKDAQKALAEEKSLEVAVHSAQIEFTKAANQVALALKDVAAAGRIKDIIAQGIGVFARDAGRVGRAFSLQEAYLVGSTGELRKGLPLVLDAHFTVDGKQYREYFAASPRDAALNALSFGLLPVIVAEHLVQDLGPSLAKELAPKWGPLQGDVSTQFSTWVQAHIYELVGGLRENMEKQITGIQSQLAQEESTFKRVLDSLDAHAGAFSPGYRNLTGTADQILATYELTDFMPASSRFTNSYLAVGHSALCLGVADNGVDVYQQSCKDRDTEQWTATVVKDPDGGDSGYVQLRSKGLCLKARNLDAASGQPLVLAQCSGQDEHEKWKVTSQDGLYDRIINRYAQKCLHFDTENANEKAGYAVWTSCFGSDSEGFRAIADAEKPTFHRVNDMLKAAGGTCLSASAYFAGYFARTARGHATSTRDEYRMMRMHGHNVLTAGACDGDARDRFNYVEKPNGDVKIVHAESGWCVAVDRTARDALVLAPCDNGDDMYWRTRDNRGDAFELLNLEHNACLDLEPARGRAGAGGSQGAARIAPCRETPGQFIDFLHK